MRHSDGICKRGARAFSRSFRHGRTLLTAPKRHSIVLKCLGTSLFIEISGHMAETNPPTVKTSLVSGGPEHMSSAGTHLTMHAIHQSQASTTGAAHEALAAQGRGGSTQPSGFSVKMSAPSEARHAVVHGQTTWNTQHGMSTSRSSHTERYNSEHALQSQPGSGSRILELEMELHQMRQRCQAIEDSWRLRYSALEGRYEVLSAAHEAAKVEELGPQSVRDEELTHLRSQVELLKRSRDMLKREAHSTGERITALQKAFGDLQLAYDREIALRRKAEDERDALARRAKALEEQMKLLDKYRNQDTSVTAQYVRELESKLRYAESRRAEAEAQYDSLKEMVHAQPRHSSLASDKQRRLSTSDVRVGSTPHIDSMSEPPCIQVSMAALKRSSALSDIYHKSNTLQQVPRSLVNRIVLATIKAMETHAKNIRISVAEDDSEPEEDDRSFSRASRRQVTPSHRSRSSRSNSPARPDGTESQVPYRRARSHSRESSQSRGSTSGVEAHRISPRSRSTSRSQSRDRGRQPRQGSTSLPTIDSLERSENIAKTSQTCQRAQIESTNTPHLSRTHLSKQTTQQSPANRSHVGSVHQTLSQSRSLHDLTDVASADPCFPPAQGRFEANRSFTEIPSHSLLFVHPEDLYPTNETHLGIPEANSQCNSNLSTLIAQLETTLKRTQRTDESTCSTTEVCTGSLPLHNTERMRILLTELQTLRNQLHDSYHTSEPSAEQSAD